MYPINISIYNISVNISIISSGIMTHNVPDVGDVLGAETSKNKGNPFHTPLRFQDT